MTHDKAYWNLHRVMERILASCDVQRSLPESLPDSLPPSSLDGARIRQTSIMTSSGKIIRIIRKST